MTSSTIQTHSLHLPDFWASPLINGDYSGLEPEDEKELNDFIEQWKDDLYINTANIPSDENCYFESHFMNYHDASNLGVLACDCCEYIFEINPNSSLYESN